MTAKMCTYILIHCLFPEDTQMNRVDSAIQLRLGYASLLGVPATVFDAPGFVFEIVEKRSNVAWGGNWFQPIWAVSLFQTTVPVASEYARQAKKIFGSLQYQSLLSSELIAEVQTCFGPDGWQGLEILYYPCGSLPDEDPKHRVCKLSREHPEYRKYAPEFSGGTYVIFDPDDQILSWAGIKDHGAINEIAVGTVPEHRRRGLGKAAVACAVADILSRGRVPVYVPDAVTNQGSYALARSLGFRK